MERDHNRLKVVFYSRMLSIQVIESTFINRENKAFKCIDSRGIAE